jgi:hypothetical protein
MNKEKTSTRYLKVIHCSQLLSLVMEININITYIVKKNKFTHSANTHGPAVPTHMAVWIIEKHPLRFLSNFCFSASMLQKFTQINRCYGEFPGI